MNDVVMRNCIDKGPSYVTTTREKVRARTLGSRLSVMILCSMPGLRVALMIDY